MSNSKGSSAVVRSGKTILDTIIQILASRKNSAMTPAEIAEIGRQKGLLVVPRGRTKNYLSQLLQSRMYDNSTYAAYPVIVRTAPGMYRAKKSAINS